MGYRMRSVRMDLRIVGNRPHPGAQPCRGLHLALVAAGVHLDPDGDQDSYGGTGMTKSAIRRLMSRSEAAAYCALSVPTFTAVCSVRPVPLGPGKRLERFDQADLDKWIDGLKGIEAKSDFDQALEALNGDEEEETGNTRH
ncbi:hypothetical protein [Devosia limi]|nr:hypothetical protein [Devosia limi]SHE88784.1 hypothetical protein SAMN02745223_01327 [Devosia limi DSM 17137]